MSINIASRIETNTSLISALIAGIKRGEIKIPQFQRQFVWKDEQALDLLDSIAKNYPVGSLLLWRTKEKLREERDIGSFRLPVTDDMSPTDYVLDGQQRLTVIYSCLGAPDDGEGFSVAYDLNAESFIRYPNNPRPYQFPLRQMFNTTHLLNFRTGLQKLEEKEEYQARLDLLVAAFADYRIPVVTLKDLTVAEVCPIFERINSSGTKLSTYDLMVAATWTHDFDLNDEVDEIQDALLPKGFSDIDRTTVLKCLSAVHLGTIKEDALKTLRDTGNAEMRALIDRTKQALLRVVDLLSTEFNVYSWDFLSYEALVVILSSIYADATHLDVGQVSRAKQWFWRASFSERYKVGGENFVSRDLEKVRGFVVSDDEPANFFGEPPSPEEWKSITFRSNVSRSRAFVLALASRNPCNLTNGSRIDPAEALSTYNKKQFHHIYPRAYLRRLGLSERANLLLNICMLSAASNNAVSDADPHTYLPSCASDHQAAADSIFESNLLPRPSEFNYSAASYEDFISARLDVVQPYVTRLCNGGM